MKGSSGPRTIRFDVFRFDVDSGELWRDDDRDGRRVTRLAPQPARLLEALIDRRPRVVSAEEIREILWPDVHVEIDQSLRTYIRQIRHALGDSATEPRYVETIPRRGYRFLGLVDGRPDREPERPGGRRRIPATAILVTLGLAVLLIAALVRFTSGPQTQPVRIAVMSFEPTATAEGLAAGNDLAETLVDLLVRRDSDSIEVVGPTTTAGYEGQPLRYDELRDELDIDLVIHGRATQAESGTRILVEVIRASDGAHLWARYLDDLPQGLEAAHAIADGVLAALE